MAFWLRKQPTEPGLYDHRNNDGPVAIPARRVFVGFVNWEQDPKLGHGTRPAEYAQRKLRAVRADHPLTTDALTVSEWGGEWRRILTRCQAGGDGDCIAKQCPQLRDGEPRATGRHCPLDNDEGDLVELDIDAIRSALKQLSKS